MPSLDFLIWLQQFRSGFTDALFVGASALGAEEAYMALLTAIYLCVGHRFGFHLFVMFLASAYSNSQLKALADTHRPFLLHPQLNPLYPGSAEGQSFPSGHAQNAAVVWGIIAIRQRSARVRVAIIALVLLIALSRLYLQVHWPVDVIGGLASGLLLVLIYLIAVGVWASRQCDPGRVAWALVIVIGSALMFLFGYHEATCVRSTGALLGSGLGYLLLERRGGFRAAAPPLNQVVKVIVALAVLAGVQHGGRALLGEAAWATVLRYTLIGFTAAYVLPVFFTVWHERRERRLASRGAGV